MKETFFRGRRVYPLHEAARLIKFRTHIGNMEDWLIECDLLLPNNKIGPVAYEKDLLIYAWIPRKFKPMLCCTERGLKELTELYKQQKNLTEKNIKNDNTK